MCLRYHLRAFCVKLSCKKLKCQRNGLRKICHKQGRERTLELLTNTKVNSLKKKWHELLSKCLSFFRMFFMEPRCKETKNTKLTAL